MSQKGTRQESSKNQRTEKMKILCEIILLFIKIFWSVLEATYRLYVPLPKKSVRGEIVLITGAAQGIGKELALQYSSQGATVVCWDVNEEGNLATLGEIAKLGYPKAYAYVCNVANCDEVKETVKAVEDEVGDISIVINNAGIMPCHSLLQHASDEIQRIMDINVMAHFWIIQAVLPTMMKHNHGHIVALSSCAGLAGFKNLVPYCASKWAVRGMMEALQQELLQIPSCRIKLTTVYPYLVDTALLVKPPKIRFSNFIPILHPSDVAKYIMNAQQRNVRETTIPRSLLTTSCVARMLPNKAALALQDFLDTYVEQDL